MPKALPIEIDGAALRARCERWGIIELSLFGSVLREDFGPESDIDLLVTYRSGFRPGLRERLDMEEEFAALFGRRVDLVERRLIEESPNYIRRRSILEALETIYAA